MQGAQSVSRALQIMELFSRDRPTWTVRQLCEALQLTTPTAHRLVRTLAGHGFLSADPASNSYTVGPSVLRLADILLVPEGHKDLHTLALPELERLRELTQETVGMHRRVGLHRMAVAELESPQALRLSLGTGRMRPVYSGAVGKVFMAHMSRGELSKVVAAAASAGHALPSELLEKELGLIVEQGYAVSVSEATPGASAVAAPIPDGHQHVLAVMSISGPEQRWTRELMNDAAGELTASVERIAERLLRTTGTG